jgi:hypothetical protein
MKRKSSAGYTQVRTRSTVLTALEEKVLRMRHGIRASRNLLLERIDQGHPAIAKQVAAIERRARAAAGTRENSSKQKIVRALRSLKS